MRSLQRWSKCGGASEGLHHHLMILVTYRQASCVKVCPAATIFSAISFQSMPSNLRPAMIVRSKSLSDSWFQTEARGAMTRLVFVSIPKDSVECRWSKGASWGFNEEMLGGRRVSSTEVEEEKMCGNVRSILYKSYGHPFVWWIKKARSGERAWEASPPSTRTSLKSSTHYLNISHPSKEGTKKQSTGAW